MGQNMGPPSDPMSASQVRRVSLSSPVELTAQLAAEAAAVVATRHCSAVAGSNGLNGDRVKRHVQSSG